MTNEEKDKTYRSGFVTIVGRPNVGKSTLLNVLIGQKVAITSDKPQTTRHRIQGVLHKENAQIVFVDTPGIHKPKHRLGEWMVQLAENALNGVDAVCFVLEADELPGPGDRYIAEQLRQLSCPIVGVLNKMDLPPKEDPSVIASAVEQLLPFDMVIGVSARTGSGVEALKQYLLSIMPPGPQYFPPGMETDQPERHLIAELIREQALLHTRDEVPHSVAVVVEEMTERAGGKLYVRAVIYVERESQKGILIGKNGAMLRRIGAAARQEIESLLLTSVFLDLWVKVHDNWRNRESTLRQLGYLIDE